MQSDWHLRQHLHRLLLSRGVAYDAGEERASVVEVGGVVQVVTRLAKKITGRPIYKVPVTSLQTPFLTTFYHTLNKLARNTMKICLLLRPVKAKA
jgi:hypothetical protein